ncbi:DUF1028 domain-containing protein [Gemmatimonas sp.]|uniref:DUF1028 domain-containing protein n=1 Tax=Gemmatimonas sp. TaxID=1962908 RepID=UPI0039838285
MYSRARRMLSTAASVGFSFAVTLATTPRTAQAQEPYAWRDSLVFHTFSIAAIDPRTGEVGVAVTTRVPCVGNGVPWVRKGVGAVATQASTRTEYGVELLDALASGEAPDAALKRALAADSGFQSRQVAVISIDGRSAQHTGTGPNAWAGHRAGKNYVTQGNILVGPEVIDAVARSFEASEGTPYHLADRLITALNAGFVLGGDKRHGLRTSAAVIVADSRAGMSRRSDGQTANINVCENADPVGELRRIYDAVSQTLGYRTLEQFSGGDVYQLKVMLNALGFYKRGETVAARGPEATLFTTETVAAVDAFRTSEKMSTPTVGGSPAGLVDDETVARLWAALERVGKATTVRQQLLDNTLIRR